MIDFVLWLSRAQATDTDFEGENVEVKPGNGCSLAGLAGLLFGLNPGHFCCPFLVAEAGGRRVTRSSTRVVTLASLRFGAVPNGSPLTGSTMSPSMFWSCFLARLGAVPVVESDESRSTEDARRGSLTPRSSGLGWRIGPLFCPRLRSNPTGT